MGIIKKLVALGLSISFCGLIVSTAPLPVAAFNINAPNANQRGNGICSGSGGGTAYCGDSNGAGTDQITGQNGIILKIANVAAVIGGVAAVIVIIVGSMHLIRSAGDASRVSTGRSMIIYALIGIIAIAMARFGVQFVIGRFLR